MDALAGNKRAHSAPHERLPTMSSAPLRNNASRHRYERDVEGGTAFASYRLEAGTVAIFHTDVPAALRGSAPVPPLSARFCKRCAGRD